MRKSFFTIVQYIFFLSLGVLFIWLTVKDINKENWQKIQHSLQQARHIIIIPVVVMLLLSHYIRAVRWRMLMEPLGYKPTLFNTWSAVMIGYLVNAGVPRLGEVVKCTLLAKYENVRADKLLGTIVIERIIDLICLVIVFILAILFQGYIIGNYIKELFQTSFSDSTGRIAYEKVLILIFSLFTLTGVVYFLFRQFAHVNLIVRIKKIIMGILSGLGSIRNIKRKKLFLIHTFLIWFLYLASATAGLYALRETEHLGWGGGLTTLGVGSVAMILTPGGIGAFPLLVAKLMELYGLDVKTTGAAIGWLLWSVQTLLILGGGIIFSGLFTYHHKKRRFENRQ
ncbi:MAG: lysylphosphatidylglycerol synthase transmembrane domain-containing protein [Chitinophagaceae bacterium]